MNFTPPPTCCVDQLPTARFKMAPEDFIVDEILGFEPGGQGEHIWIQVRKTGSNTRDLVDKIAAATGVAGRDIGYSGLKDKWAVTTQWFSFRQPIGASVPKGLYEIDGVDILRAERSDRKLRTGSHRRNKFSIVLRNLIGDHQLVERQIESVTVNGFPNYFGPQRFGHDGRNISAALAMFRNQRKKVTRFKRGMYLSAARAWIFNQVLGQRILKGSWLTVKDGDVCMLNGSQSIFQVTEASAELQHRHDTFDVHLTGPLAGKGQSLASAEVLELEDKCLTDEIILVEGLCGAGLKQERRALRAIAESLTHCWIDSDTLKLEFELARGVYATSLLRELVVLDER